MSGSRFPAVETILAGLAVASLAVCWWLPPTPYLAPTLRPWTLALSGGWVLWRIVVLDGYLKQYRAWRVSPTWITTPKALRRREGICLGKAFRWTGTHVEVLESALRREGTLPAATGPRGGYPALQAVGAREEEALTVSWEGLKRHTSLLGTTGSGKSRALEAIIAQAIGERP